MQAAAVFLVDGDEALYRKSRWSCGNLSD